MRFLHTMLRVRDLDAALAFYQGLLGLEEVRRRVDEKNRYTLVFLAAPEDAPAAKELLKAGKRDASVIELTHNWGDNEYEIGTAYGHLAIAVPDIYKTCDELAAQGVKIPRPAGPMKHGGRPIAFIEDPDGYKIELVERA